MNRRTRYAATALAFASAFFADVVPVAAAPPANDDFRGAVTVHVGQSIKGTVSGASAEPPDEYRAAQSVWYRFRVKRDVMIDISACGKADPAITVYRGHSSGRCER
jgi:hypothetical protein